MQSSTYTVDGHAQIDGRRYVREAHVDVTGKEHTSTYLAPADWTATEYTARMNERAARIDAALAEAEAAALLEQE